MVQNLQKTSEFEQKMSLKRLMEKKTHPNTNLCRFLIIFGATWEPPGPNFGALLVLLGTSWSHWGRLWVVLGALGVLLASLGRFLDQCLTIFAYFRIFLPNCADLGAHEI